MILSKSTLALIKFRSTVFGATAATVSFASREDVVILTIPLTNIIIAFIGAVISIGLIKGGLTFKVFFFSLLGGTACGAFLPPLLINKFNLGEGVEVATSFLLGLGGMTAIRYFTNKYGTPTKKETDAHAN